MYEILKAKLIVFVINGCKLSDWIYFNNKCSEELTKKEYSYIKKMKDYKIIDEFFNNQLNNFINNENFVRKNPINVKNYKDYIKENF